MNSKELKLSNPPLVETWLSVDVEGGKNLTSAEFQKIAREDFSGVKFVRILAERSTDVRENGDIRIEKTTENRAAGVVIDFEKALPMQVVLKTNRIECKILGSYPRWDTFINLATGIVLKCMQRIGDVIIRKLSVRSVNKIYFPEGVSMFADVLNMKSLDPDTNLQGVCADMLHRDTQFYRDYDAFATVARVYRRAPSEEKRTTPIILDIDVFKIGREGDGLLLNDSTLSSLHELKNRLFVGALTAKQLEHYK